MKKINNILLSFLTLLLCCSLVFAEDVSDFDAETIQGEEFLSGTQILPVELAEEQDARQLAIKKLEEENLGGELAEEGQQASISKRRKVDLSQTTTILNVNEIEIAALIKSISKLTDRNYILDDGVKGKISINLNTPVTIEEALKILDAVLLLKGFTTIPIDKNIWKVVAVAEAKQTTLPLHLKSPDRPTDMFITQVIRLEYVPANDIQQLLQQFVSSGGSITSFSGTNAIILIDSAANIERLTKLVDLLDTPADDQDITIIPIVYAEATDVSEKINEILGTEDENSTNQQANSLALSRTNNRVNNNARGRSNSRTQASQAASSNSVERNVLPVKIIPDERTNSLIVVADQSMTTKVKALVERLDSKLDLSSGRFYVYNVKHADAESLSEILNNLISGTEGTESESTTRTTGSSLSRTNSNNRTDSSSNTAAATRERIRQALRTRNLLTGGGREDGKVNFEGEVSISADPSTNTLIINASKTDYLRVKEVIDQLDIQRRQVVVEATLIEVTLSDEKALGIELQGSTGGKDLGILAQSSFGSLNNLLLGSQSGDTAALGNALTDLTLAAASSGTVTLPGGITVPSQAVLVKALSSVSNVNVLSSPTILAMDNEEAEIIVGENVPFVTSRSTDTANIANTFNSIERQDVGITLRITPQISAGDYVVLSIFVEISNVVPATRTDPNGPTTTIRTAETMVEVQDGQMIATGGLIADNVTEATRGIPFLEDLPVLGHLFKREDTTRRRTNLLVLITPRIASDQFEARDYTLAARDKMENAIKSMPGDINPSRSEILRSEQLDYVVNELPLEITSPTTITPPRSKVVVDEEIPEPTEIVNDAPSIEDARENAMKRFEKASRTEKNVGAIHPPSLKSSGGQVESPVSTPKKSSENTKQTSSESLNISVAPELPEIPEED